MADVTEMWSRRARESPTLLGGILALSCCSYILFRRLKKRKTEIIVFSRYPEAGKAKTRLIPSLSELGAAQLQVCMTEHILKVLRQYEVSNKDVDVTLQYNGGTYQQMKYWLDRKTKGMSCFYRPQRGSDLGEKLQLAVSDSFSRGHESVVVIGADIPGITEDIIDTAFQSLQKEGTDMVLGRAEDGGYYLIGLHKSSKHFLDKLFDNIEWGTNKVFQQQMNQAKLVGAHPDILPVVLEDVDTIEDLDVFEKEVGIKVDQLKTVKWSIIVPALNEEKNILDTLKNIEKYCNDINNIKEIIVSDGGSKDGTVEVVKSLSESFSIPLKIISSTPGRGNQLIQGVESSSGDYLLFLHADTKLPQNFDKMAAKCIQKPGVVCGAFQFQLDILADEKLKSQESHWFLFQMKLLSWGTRIRNHYESPYGDMGLFMTRKTYKEVGGFPPFYLMEDYILVEKLRTMGHISIAEGDPIITSYRRWKKWGLIKVTGLNQLIILAYKLGVHPNTLAEWYYGKRRR